MVANQQYTRIDTLELKVILYRKIGLQRSEKYFDLLRRLFVSKISKNEFDKLCIRTIGRENLSLHNRLIQSIVKNACLAKVPPSTVKRGAGSLNVKVGNGYQRNSLQSLYSDAFPLSPRKSRSPRDRKFRDRPSPLGPHGKTHGITCEEGEQRVQEHQSPTELLSLGSRPPVEVLSVEDGEEVVSKSPSVQSRSPVTAPLGISLKVGGARKTLCSGAICNIHPETCQNSCELPDSRSLRSLLERKLENEGLTVSVDCANLLNNGLDSYLKRLVESCVGLARSRSGQIIPGLNGTLPGSRHWQRPITSVAASMLDFRVAVESNSHILGGDWATQLEKICARAFEK